MERAEEKQQQTSNSWVCRSRSLLIIRALSLSYTHNTSICSEACVKLKDTNHYHMLERRRMAVCGAETTLSCRWGQHSFITFWCVDWAWEKTFSARIKGYFLCCRQNKCSLIALPMCHSGPKSIILSSDSFSFCSFSLLLKKAEATAWVASELDLNCGQFNCKSVPHSVLQNYKKNKTKKNTGL